jgi:aminoglycoside phosphotransferase (APT) family kinase protein
MLGPVERVELLDKGYSHDRKFVLYVGAEPRYLLRLSGAALVDRRRAEFDVMAAHHERSILCQKPHAFGVDEEAGLCWAVLDWLPGECAEDVLPRLNDTEQFDLGAAAGRELRKLHEIPCPDGVPDWYTLRKAKYERYRDRAQQLSLTFFQQEAMEQYADANVEALRGVRSTFQHDDYHPGNLLVEGGRFAGVVDFNRFDWGDPWHDFYKVPWFALPVSRAFSRGQVLGYFDGRVPGEFWLRYHLYIAMNLHGSVVWAHENPNAMNLDWWQGEVRRIVTGHDFTASGLPPWF